MSGVVRRDGFEVKSYRWFDEGIAKVDDICSKSVNVRGVSKGPGLLDC